MSKIKELADKAIDLHLKIKSETLKLKKLKYELMYEMALHDNKEVEAKDHIRNFQPPVDGIEIMKLFNLNAGKEIGILKNAIKDAILDGKVKNNKQDALKFILQKAKELNLEPVKEN